MKKELEALLFQRYPKLFEERAQSPQELGMYWGFECGDGWFDLIDTLCRTIQSDIEGGDTPPVRVVQVKEKFGTLRFHIRGGNERVRGMIDMARTCSKFIAE